MRYLLDTNIISDMVRNPSGSVVRKIREVGQDRVCTSIVVAAELRYGAIKKGSELLAARVQSALAILSVMPLEPPADEVYGELRVQLESEGRPIGGNDLLIAAQAVALGYTIVTDNEREFSRIKQLACENWLR